MEYYDTKMQTKKDISRCSDLHQILAESSSYVVESETGSFASGSDLQVILAESSSYVTLDETGSFASGSDIQIILAESASYVTSTSTGSYLQQAATASLGAVGLPIFPPSN